MSVEANIFFNFFEGKRKIHASKLVRIMACAVKDTVYACGIKCEIEKVDEFGIEVLQEKDARCLYDKTGVGISLSRDCFGEKCLRM